MYGFYWLIEWAIYLIDVWVPIPWSPNCEVQSANCANLLITHNIKVSVDVCHAYKILIDNFQVLNVNKGPAQQCFAGFCLPFVSLNSNYASDRNDLENKFNVIDVSRIRMSLKTPYSVVVY